MNIYFYPHSHERTKLFGCWQVPWLPSYDPVADRIANRSSSQVDPGGESGYIDYFSADQYLGSYAGREATPSFLHVIENPNGNWEIMHVLGSRWPVTSEKGDKDTLRKSKKCANASCHWATWHATWWTKRHAHAADIFIIPGTYPSLISLFRQCMQDASFLSSFSSP